MSLLYDILRLPFIALHALLNIIIITPWWVHLMLSPLYTLTAVLVIEKIKGG